MRPFDPDKHCGAHPDWERGPCRAGKGKGTPHPGIGRCAHHGGLSPNAIASGQRQRLEADMQALGVPIHLATADGLRLRIAEVLGELQWLQALIRAEADTDPEATFRGTRSVKRTDDGDGGISTTSEAGPMLSVKMQTYEKWSRLYRELVTVALAHEIDQRQLDVMEREAETHGALVAAALDAAGVTGDQRVKALNAARDRFRVVYGAA